MTKPSGAPGALGMPESTEAVDKRRGKRTPACVEFRVHGESGSFVGQTIDLSRSGALLWITDERFVSGEDVTNMVRFSERVAAEFGSGMDVEFADGAVRRDAEIVRVTRKGRDDRTPMLVACRFTLQLKDEEFERLGIEPPEREETGPHRAGAAPHPGEPPAGIGERRRYPRVDRILYVEATGDHGTYRAYALNVSCSGALLTISDPAFAPPAEPDQLVLFTKRLELQFRSGMIVRFLEAGVTVEVDVVRVNERTEGDELLVVIGARFRRVLTRDECARLDVAPPEHEPEAPRPEQAERPVRRGPSVQTRILDLMQQAVRLGASDIHVKVGSPPRLRVHGELTEISDEPVRPDEAHAMALELMTPTIAHRFNTDDDVEFAHTVRDLGRFRVNCFKERGYTGLAVRTIPDEVPTLAGLGLPDAARSLAESTRGLVLVTGSTGAGKSHTLAAMVHHINGTRAAHVITIEDPIEFLHRDERSHITQREVGRDCRDFATALARAQRQDPDVIVVGEMRDLETTTLALKAAETGHLVLAALPMTSAAQTPARIIESFPPDRQAQVRQQLAHTLRGVFTQLLVRRCDRGVALANEVLLVDDKAREAIRASKTDQLRHIIEKSRAQGMITLEASLSELVAEGLVAYETAIARANVPRDVVEPPARAKA